MDTNAAAVRRALLANGFTLDGVTSLIGDDAFAALGRGRTAPAKHALAKGGPAPLGDLIRLFLLGEPVPVERVAAALPSRAAAALGLITGEAQPLLQIQPYPATPLDGYVVSDFPAGRGPTPPSLPPEHVIGVGAASVTLATLTPRRWAARVLDLGTGCGIQAILAAGHSDRVTATDISDRALRHAALTAALSATDLDLRRGSLFGPVAEDRFDLIVANPPFVMAPEARFVYREAPYPGDELSRTVIAGAAQRLAPDGLAVMLCNWLHVSGQSWQDRLAAWAPPDCQMWVAQRELLSPAQYAELWLQDSAEYGGPGYEQRYSEWLDYFEQLQARAIGFGWVVLRRRGGGWFTAEDVAEAERLPTGEEVLEQMDHYAAMHAASALAVLQADPGWMPGVELHRSWFPADKAPPELHATRSWRPAERFDPVLLELLRTPGSLLERIESLATDVESEDDLTARALLGVRRLVGAGMLSLR